MSTGLVEQSAVVLGWYLEGTRSILGWVWSLNLLNRPGGMREALRITLYGVTPHFEFGIPAYADRSDGYNYINTRYNR